MPNTNAQLNNIIKQLSRVVGGSSRIAHSYASIPQKVDFANKQANRLKYVAGLSGDSSVGTLFSAPSFDSTSGFSTAGGMQAAVTAQGIQLSTNTELSYANRYILDSVATDLPYWAISATFIMSSINLTQAIAVGVGTTSINTETKTEIAGYINTADPDAPLILTAGIDGTFSNIFQGNPMPVADGDLVTLKLVREQEVFSLYAYNLTTGVNTAIRGTYVPTDGRVLPNIGKFSAYLYGGVYTLVSMEISSIMPNGLPSILIGDSKIAGYYASLFPLNIAGQLKIIGYRTDQLAGGSEMTIDVLHRIQEIIDLQPQKVILAIGSNDIRYGTSTPTWQANYSNIVTQLEGAGITVVHLLPPKETSINIDPLYNYVNNTYSSNKIDAYTGFNTGTMLYADGIHPNALGMNFIVQQINNSGLIPK